jgi:hypothetical protein
LKETIVLLPATLSLTAGVLKIKERYVGAADKI